VLIKGQPLRISIGIGLGRGDASLDYDALFRAADQAMYQAKADGRGVTRLSQIP